MTDESDRGHPETPDWPAELEEPVARLGPPSAVFRIPRRHAAFKAASGVGAIVFGGLANYFYWVVLNGPVVAEHLLLLLLFGPVVSGAGLLYAAWRDRGLWVLAYPVGLLRWQRGGVVTFPWDEVTRLAFHRVRECDPPQRRLDTDGNVESAWLPIARSGSRTLGCHLAVTREDGAEAILPSSIRGFDRLCRLVQEETFRRMWPEAWGRFSQGMRVPFGPLAVSPVGIHRDGDLLAWDDLEDAVIQNGKLVLHSRRGRRAWAEAPLHLVENPHVLAALLYAGRRRPVLEVDDSAADDDGG